MDGYGVDDLRVMIEAAMEESMSPFEALLPYTHSGLVNLVRENGIVRHEDYTEHGIRLSASANLSTIARIEEFITEFVPRARIFGWRRDQALREMEEEEEEEEEELSVDGEFVEEGDTSECSDACELPWLSDYASLDTIPIDNIQIPPESSA